MAKKPTNERPILMSGEMVRAILEGRKTQTRRVAKLLLPADKDFIGAASHEEWVSKRILQCPYGQPGGRLWVRETLQHGSRNNPAPRHNHLWRYAADNALVMVSEDRHTEMLVWATHKEGDTCVSIHMPRWASRITLEITKIRVERVQEISEADSIAEGVREVGGNFAGCYSSGTTLSGTNAKDCYQRLWDSINAKRGFGWDVNPWCWVIEFRGVAKKEALR